MSFITLPNELDGRHQVFAKSVLTDRNIAAGWSAAWRTPGDWDAGSRSSGRTELFSENPTGGDPGVGAWLGRRRAPSAQTARCCTRRARRSAGSPDAACAQRMGASTQCNNRGEYGRRVVWPSAIVDAATV